MIKKRMFGELELAILKVFNNQSILTVKQVQEALKGDDKYTTIMTVMNRLVEKKDNDTEMRRDPGWAVNGLMPCKRAHEEKS